MIDAFAAVLRGAPGAAAALCAMPVPDVLEAADRHGVLPLLADRFSDPPVRGELAPALVAAARRHAAADLVRERALTEVIGALTVRRLPFLLVKGAHLAYAYYPRPDLRPRLDTDVVVPGRTREATERQLESLGYGRTPAGGGDLIFYQSLFTKRHGGHIAHVVDLHWRLANPQAFGGVLPWDVLVAHARPVAALGGAPAPGAVEALLLACVHQVAHHPSDERLIWIEDVRRLSPALDADAWERFADLAAAQQVGAVCLRVLERAQQLLDAAVPRHILDDRRLAGGERREASAAWLQPGRRRVRTVTEDLTLMPSWSARSRLVLQYLFPPPSYMRSVYAPASPWPLPALYAQRIWRGAWRWLRGA